MGRERLRRSAFTDFLLGVLDLDPTSRWTPRQAAQHPFITGGQELLVAVRYGQSVRASALVNSVHGGGSLSK